MKKEVNIFEFAEEILKALPRGILLTSNAEDRVNAMTIGWGSLGIEWGAPIFTVYVRTGRFTNELIKSAGEFTVCIPHGDKYSKEVARALTLCGTRTGREHDKIAESGLHFIDCDKVRSPAIKEFPLTIECSVVLAQVQSTNSIPDKFKKFYPKDVPSTNTGATPEPHVAYYGEILKSYIIEDKD